MFPIYFLEQYFEHAKVERLWWCNFCIPYQYS